MALILGAIGTVFSQSTIQKIHSICLGSFVEVDRADFDEAAALGYLYTESYSQHLTQVFLGEYVQKEQAESKLEEAKRLGYADAYVTSRKLSAEDLVEVIQLGIELNGEKIHWAQYAAAAPISVLLDGPQIRIVTGPYPSPQATRKKIEELKNLGFANTFMRAVYSLRLHPVTDFEAPELFLPVPEPIMAKAQSSDPSTSQPTADFSDALTKEVVAGGMTPPPVQAIPENYQPEFTARAASEANLAMPTIRMDIQRTSALKLQTALKLADWYSGSVDGIYGQATQAALKEFLAKDDQWKRYELIKTYLSRSIIKSKSEMALAISNVIGDPDKAEKTLITSDHPMAKAYLAYIMHANKGDIEQVNALMNEANKTAFEAGTASYDITAEYAYNDITQLLNHLAQMHAANLDVAVPCWIFQRHPKESKAAFAKVNNYTMESCDLFMDWEVVSSLKTIAKELDAEVGDDILLEEKEASLRAKLFVNPVALSNQDQKQILKWNDALWKSFDSWVEADPLHQKMATSLKVAFFQSQVLLEDFYLNQGFNYKESKGLALSVLNTIVARHMTF